MSGPRRPFWILTGVLLLALTPASLARETILRVWITGPIYETPMPTLTFESLLGAPQPRSLYQWTSLIRDAGESSTIDGLAVIVDQPLLGMAQARALQNAIAEFSANGKPALVYMNYADNASYLMALGADEIMLAENAYLELVGLSAVQAYYTRMLDKIGLEADLIPIGDFKTAVEPFTRTEPSAANRAQTHRLLDSLFDTYRDTIAQRRNIERRAVDAAIAEAPLRADEAFKRKLIDRVGNYESFRQQLFKRFGSDVRVVKSLSAVPDFDVDMESPMGLYQLWNDLQDTFKGVEAAAGAKVAVIYVEGAIMNTLSEPPTFGGPVAGSVTIRAALQTAADDDTIEAVVLRVDSPGGSALASDIIWKAARNVAQNKPLVVSMGNVAGSGGYYVATAGDTIFADAATLTGSIGVFGGKFVWQELMGDHLGVAFYEFTRGRNADLFSPNHRFTDAGRAKVTDLLQETYTQFKERVLATRAPQLAKDIEELAGGRVFTGAEAVELGLVDQLGDIDDAIALAADRAGLTDPQVVVLPRQAEFAEEFMASLLGQPRPDEYDVRMPRGAARLKLPAGAWAGLLEKLTPAQQRAVAYGLQQIRVLQRERVGAFMPWPGELR